METTPILILNYPIPKYYFGWTSKNMEQVKENTAEKYELTKIVPTIDMTVPERQINEDEEIIGVTRRERSKNYEWAILNGEMTYEEAIKYTAELWKDGWDLPTYNEIDGGRLNGMDFISIASNGDFFLKKIPGHDFPQIYKKAGWDHIDNWEVKCKVVLVKRNLPNDSSLIA